MSLGHIFLVTAAILFLLAAFPNGWVPAIAVGLFCFVLGVLLQGVKPWSS